MSKTYSIQLRLRRLVIAISILLVVILIAALTMLFSANNHYA